MIPDQPGTISRLKQHHFDTTNDDFEIKNMVRSILPYLHHWTGLRLILGVPALVRFFDPLTQYFWQKYLTDQEILRQCIRTISELGACLIWAQLDHGKTGDGEEMCQTNVEKSWKFEDVTIFRRWSRINSRAFLHQKTRILTQKLMIFK